MEELRIYLISLGQPLPHGIKVFLSAAWDVWTSPWLWGLILVVLVWERIRPVDPLQPVFSAGFFQDLLWFWFEILLGVTLVPFVAGALAWIYDDCWGGPRFHLSQGWPLALAVLVGVLLVDLLHYLKHFCMHHFAHTLWHFHAIHHSQREMNLWTDRRQHLLEYILTQMVVLFPLTVLGLKPYAVMGTAAFVNLHALFVHANIRTNLGWMGLVVVSPQYHRIHHSIERQHFDKNFGAVFTVWDRLFGTLYHGRHEYPATGVKDVEFPPPRTFGPAGWLASFFRQLGYPFARLLGGKQAQTH